MTKMTAVDRETRRLAALASYEILDTPTEAAFDEVAALASQICETPIAVVNLIGEGRQFFKAEVGLGVRETPLETSFCAKAILEEDFLIVPDATKDARFDCNPLVTGEPGLRFYAGALLKTDEGLPIGTLCVLDVRPRDLSLVQQQTLRVLAHQVMTQLELRSALKERKEREARHSAIVESATDYAIIATDLNGIVTEWNSGAQLILGWTEDEMIGQSAERFFTPEDRERGIVEKEMHNAVEQGRGMDERWHLRKDGQRFWASGEMMPLKENDELVGYIKILRDRTEEKLRADQLVASEARLRASQKAGQIGTFEVDLATGVMSVTPEFCAIFGVDEQACHEPAFLETLVVQSDSHIPSNQATRTGGDAVTDVEYRIRRANDGELRWVGRRAEFAHDGAGKAIRMFGTVQDITQRKRAERKVAALLELGDSLRDAVDIGDVIQVASRILGETLGAERAGYALIDNATGAFDVDHVWSAEGVARIVRRHDFASFSATVRLLSHGDVVAIDDISQTKALEYDVPAYRAIDTQAQIMVPLVRKGGLVGVLFVHSRKARAWLATERNFVRNLADRTYSAIAKVQAEADQAILNQELSHRLKNTLAMVQAIAAQTLKHVSDRDAVEALTSRIVALSAAHDVLLQDNWLAARLDQIAHGVLDVHGTGDQIKMDGPPVELAPKAGLSLSLLLHELATNATKYGALSQTGGQVIVSWRVEQQDGQRMLTLDWQESGGPKIVQPTRTGFGSRLIKTGLIGNGYRHIDYASDGLFASFSAPMSLLQDKSA